MKRSIFAILAMAVLVGVNLTTPTTATAHAPCTGTCNTIQNIGYEGIGIYDYSGDPNWRWILPGGGYYRTDGYPLYQMDVGGFYLGQDANGKRCAQVGGS